MNRIPPAAVMYVAIGVALLVGKSRVSAQAARRPTACDGCISNWYYFDEDGSGGVQDWNCGRSSYNGHRGTDFSLSGGNGAIDVGHDLVAVADGVVINAEDGHYDRCRTCDASVDGRCGTAYGGGFGNFVGIDHGGYRAFYAHMRTGSVRVRTGDRVTCGQVIGQIGSSGCTTGAHVHFETRPPTGGYLTAYDPFVGMCSPLARSVWTGQGPYRGLPDATCDGAPPPPVCPAGTYSIWTCDAARTQRRRCVDGADMIEPCADGCISMPIGVDDLCAESPDADGDGARADLDCDDANPSIRPGAEEVCGDGVDQDCADGDAACPPPGDLGIPVEGDAAADPGDAALGGDGASGRPSAGARPGLEGGCGCRIASASTRGATTGAPLRATWLLLALAVARRRRRRAPM
jgi:hypothetical protein